MPFPLYLYPAEGEMQFEGGQRRSNLNPEFIKAVSEKLELKFIADGKGDLEQTLARKISSTTLTQSSTHLPIDPLRGVPQDGLPAPAADLGQGAFQSSSVVFQ